MAEGGNWVRAAHVDDVPPGHGYETDLEVDGEYVGLFNIDGSYYALGECTHEQGPLCQGRLDGHSVTCPWHSARFDVRSGECLEGPVACRVTGDVAIGGAQAIGRLDPARHFEIRVENGEIYVRIDK